VRPPRKDLLEGPVGRTVIDLAIPMVFGMAAVILFNVVDTFYVGRLGARELAAMSFTFPVAFMVMSVAMGMGVGVTSVISRAIGGGDRERVRRLTTDGLLLANTVVVVVAATGLATIAPLFRAIGAGDDIIPLIRSYMVPWYAGVGFLVIPMVGNSAIRATGDTRTPSIVMMIAGGVNVVLDPLLIFGIGPFPRLELQGAAVATLIAYAVTFVAAFWILARREHMLDFSRLAPSAVLRSWREILYVAAPATGTQMLVPLAAGVLTRIVSGHGTHAVAGYGVGTRVEALSMIGVHALFSALTPIVGQNYGAGKIARVREAITFALKVCAVYGLVAAALLALGARGIGALFNKDPEVITTVAHYLRIVPVTYVLFGTLLVVCASFNAMNHPLRSALLVSLRLFGLAVPLALAGSALAGPAGVFAGIAVANVLAGAAAGAAMRSFLGAARRPPS